MTTNRMEDGVRVQIKRSGETGTALYGPYRKHGRDWPGFSLTGMGWVVPVLPDRNGWRGVGLYAPSELEPAPWPKLTPTLGSRRVRHRERQETGTLLENLVFGGITWPALDRDGNLLVPVKLDDGRHRVWRASDIEPAMEREPEPSPALAPGEPPYGPRVTIMGTWTSPRVGQVLYRMKGNRYPGFDEAGDWRVPVQVDDGPLVYPTAQQLRPHTDEGTSGPAPRLLLTPREDEVAVLAEADRVANAIQAKALREAIGAAAEALELLANRLWTIALKEDENAK